MIPPAKKPVNIVYWVNDILPLGVTVLSGLQHVGLVSIFLLVPVLEACDPRGPIAIEAGFDEFNLDLRVSYEGPPLELPDKRPSNEEIIASEEGQRRLAGFLLRRQADRVRATFQACRSTILFHFDH